MALEQDIISNYLPVNRKFFTHPFWNEERSFSKSEAWLWLIAQARFEDSETSAFIGGSMVKWNRGEVPCSLRYLSEAWKWSKNKVDDYLHLLEKEGMITKRTAKGTCQTVITLCNYTTYNGSKKKKGHQKGQQGDTEGTVEGQQGDKSNIDNIVKKEEDTPQSAAPVYTDIQKESFRKFEDWIKENAPRVAQMREPFTIGQYLKIAERYKTSPGEIKILLASMHNWKKLNNSISAYLTLLNWKRREEQK